jgi:hypothetical protein
MNQSEQLYKIIFFHNLDSTEKKCFLDIFPKFLPKEMKSCISVLEIPSGREAEIVYPVMLPKFAIYCLTFNMVSFHESPEEHLQCMGHELETIVQYCCNRKEVFDETNVDNKNLEWSLKYPKVLLLGTAEDKYRQLTKDHNYERINEKLIRLRNEFSFLSPAVIVPAVDNLFFHPVSLSKPHLTHFSLSRSSSLSHPITTEISDYFKPLERYVELFQSLTTVSCDPLLKYSFWKAKLIEMETAETEIETITHYLQSFNLLTWTKAFQSIYSERTSINESIIILKPFTFFSNLTDCLLKLDKTVKPNLNDKELSQLVSEWNTKLDQTRERHRFCDLGVVSKDILDDFLKNKIVTERLLDYKTVNERLRENETKVERLIADADQLFTILKTFGIVTVCNQEFNAPVNSKLTPAPKFKFKKATENTTTRPGQPPAVNGNREKEKKGFWNWMRPSKENRSTYPDNGRIGADENIPAMAVNPLHRPVPNGVDDRLMLVSTLTRVHTQSEKIKNKMFYYFVPYLPVTVPDKLKTMKKISKVFYFALISKESKAAHLSGAKFSFPEIKKISSVPNYFMQRLTAKAEWYQKLFKDSIKKHAAPQNTNESVSKHNFSIFSIGMGSHPYIYNTDVVWDDEFQLFQVSYDENSCNPHEKLTFLLHMMENVIHEFHHGLEVLPLVSYQSKEGVREYLFPLKDLNVHFRDHFLSTVSVPVERNTDFVPEKVSLLRLFLSLFSDLPSTTVTQSTRFTNRNDFRKNQYQNYMLATLRRDFYFHFPFYYESVASKAIVHISYPPNSTESKVIQRYFTANLETVFHEVFRKFRALYSDKEVFTCSDRPTKLSDDSWISSLMFSQHPLLIYRPTDFISLRNANEKIGTNLVLTEDLEVILYEWIIIIVFMKYFYEISHIKSFRMVLLLAEGEVLSTKNFFHEFFAPEIKFLHASFNQTAFQSLQIKLKTYFQTMTTDYSLKHHHKDSYLTKLDNYFDSLTIPSLVMEFSHLVSMNYHSFSVIQGNPPYTIDKSIAGNFLYFSHNNEPLTDPARANNQAVEQPVPVLFHDLNYFAVERLHPKERKPCFTLCRCITVEGKFEDFLEKYKALFGWIGVILTIWLLWCLSNFWESKI